MKIQGCKANLKIKLRKLRSRKNKLRKGKVLIKPIPLDQLILFSHVKLNQEPFLELKKGRRNLEKALSNRIQLKNLTKIQIRRKEIKRSLEGLTLLRVIRLLLQNILKSIRRKINKKRILSKKSRKNKSEKRKRIK